jgi:hypothetical protein
MVCNHSLRPSNKRGPTTIARLIIRLSREITIRRLTSLSLADVQDNVGWFFFSDQSSRVIESHTRGSASKRRRFFFSDQSSRVIESHTRGSASKRRWFFFSDQSSRVIESHTRGSASKRRRFFFSDQSSRVIESHTRGSASKRRRFSSPFGP